MVPSHICVGVSCSVVSRKPAAADASETSSLPATPSIDYRLTDDIEIVFRSKNSASAPGGPDDSAPLPSTKKPAAPKPSGSGAANLKLFALAPPPSESSSAAAPAASAAAPSVITPSASKPSSAAPSSSASSASAAAPSAANFLDQLSALTLSSAAPAGAAAAVSDEDWGDFESGK